MVLLRALLIAFLAVTAAGCSSVSYLFQAGVGQLALYNRERPLDEVIADPRTPAAVRERLRWVPEIKAEVERELGVKATRNYTTYVDLKRPYVVWAITVAEPFEMKLKEWSFPFFGSFPYLGFFKEERARNWIEDYAAQGYDTHIRGVSAYSTLGHLRDPLLSSMLSRRKSDLVNLIFHETTHSEIYLKGGGSFNEQIASYIGDFGERAWLVRTFGEKSAEVKEWEDERADRGVFAARLKAFSEELKQFYAASAGLAPEQRKARKEERFAAFRERVKKEPWRSNGLGLARISRIADSMKNNAAVLAYLTYEDDRALFDLLHQKCEGRLDRALRYLKNFADQWGRLEKQARAARESRGEDPKVTPQSVLSEQLSLQALGNVCLDLDMKVPD